VGAEHAVFTELADLKLITYLEGSLKQVDHLLWKVLGPARGVVNHHVGTVEHVFHTLLVHGIGEAIIRRVTVVCHVAGPADANDFLENGSTTTRVDGETGGPIVSGPTVQVDGLAAEFPTGFIGCEMLSIADVLLDFFVGRLEFSAHTQHGLSTGAACQVDAIGMLKSVGDLAIRHAAVLVEIGDGGLGIRTDLTGRGTDDIGSLLGMPATHASATTAALPLVDADFSANGLDGDLFLILQIDLVILGDVAATIGAALRQSRFEGFVDLIIRRRWTMAVLAVVGAAGPGSGFGIIFGRPLGEGSGLSFAGTPDVFELGLQTIAFGLELRNALLQFGNAMIALSASRAVEDVHTFSVAQRVVASCASIVTNRLGITSGWALHKHNLVGRLGI